MWDWTQASRTTVEHSTHLANEQILNIILPWVISTINVGSINS